MSATIRRLSILGPDHSKVGVVELGTGRFEVIASDARVKARLEKLFGQPFDESIGFPPRRIQALQGSLEAFEAAVEYVQRALGFECSLLSVSSFDTSSSLETVLTRTGMPLCFDPVSCPEGGGEFVSIRRPIGVVTVQHA